MKNCDIKCAMKVISSDRIKHAQHIDLQYTMYSIYDKRTHNMAVSIATYGDRGRFVDNHNVLVDMYEGDGLAGNWYFVPATIHRSGVGFRSAPEMSDRVQ